MINSVRAILFLILIGLSLFQVACNPQQKEMEKRLAGEQFAGIIPCADCEGIAYSVEFYANSRYQSSSMYVGESNKRFTEQGSWRMLRDSTLLLQNQEGRETRFRLDNERLLMLDRDGNKVQGSLASRYELLNTRTHKVEGSLKTGENNSHIDFKAHGNEPFWGLQIDKDRMLVLRIVSGDSVQTPVSEAEIDSVTRVETFRANTERHNLKVNLHPIGCIDSMSGQVYDYRVEVQRDGKTFTGCGGYLHEPEE